MGLDVFGETVVGLLFLHFQHFGHVAVRVAQFQFPMYKAAVNVHPVADGLTPAYLHGYVLEALLVAALGNLGHYFLLVDVLLKRQ